MFPILRAYRQIEGLQKEVHRLSLQLKDVLAKQQALAQEAAQAKVAYEHQKMINAQQAQTIAQLQATNQAAIDAGFDANGTNVLQQISDAQDAASASLSATQDTPSDTSGAATVTSGADATTPATPAS